MTPYAFLFSPLLWLAFIVFVSFCAGDALNRSAASGLNWVERFFVNTTVGLACLIVLMCVVAVLGLLYFWVVLVALLLLMCGAIYAQKAQWLSMRLSVTGFVSASYQHMGLILVVMAYFLPETYRLFLPDARHDSMTYHLPLIAGWAEQHGLSVDLYLRYPLNALNFNILYAMAYVIDGEVLARSLHALSVLLITCGIYALCVRFFDRWVGFLAALLFLLNGEVIALMGYAYIDLGLSLFVFTTVYFLLRYQRFAHQRLVLLSAFMLAMVIGTKYLGLVYLLPITVWAIVLMRHHHQLKSVSKFALIVIGFGSFWYIRNIFYSGNPIHPFAQNIFGFWLWTPDDLIRQSQDILKTTGVERNILEFLKLPYYFINQPQLFRNVQIDPINVLGMVASIPALFYRGVIRMMGLFVLVNAVFWFFTSQIPRYLLPTLPFISVLAAFYLFLAVNLLGKLLIKRPVDVHWRSYVKPSLAVVLLFVAVSKPVEYFIKMNEKRSFPQNQQQWRFQLNQNRIGELATIAQENTHTGVLYNLNLRKINYYFDGLVVGDWFGLANISLFRQEPSVDEMMHELKKHRADHLVISKEGKIYRRLAERLMLEQDFQLLHENKAGYLFEVLAVTD